MRSEVYNAILKYRGYETGSLFPCISVGITRQPIPEQSSQGQEGRSNSRAFSLTTAQQSAVFSPNPHFDS